MKFAEGNQGVLVILGALALLAAGYAVVEVRRVSEEQEVRRVAEVPRSVLRVTPSDDERDAERRALAERIPPSRDKPPPKAQMERVEPPAPPPASPLPVRQPKYQAGEVIRLKKYGGNAHAWIVWHPVQFKRIKDATGIGDKEGIDVMKAREQLNLIKDDSTVRVLKHVEFSFTPGEDIYEVRVLEDEVGWDRRLKTKGLLGYAYEYSLGK